MPINSRFVAMAAVVSAMFMLSGCASAPAEAAFEEANALQLVYGDGVPTIDGAYPAEETLRVYWFWSSQSQCSRRAEPGIEALVEAHPDVEVIAVHSNADESMQSGQETAAERGLAAPLYRDQGARLAEKFDARITPEVVVVDAEGVIYQGRPVRFDGDQLLSFVEAAVDAWKIGEAVDPEYRRPTGCVIRRP